MINKNIPITRDALISWGFEGFNEHFSYLCFPAPLYGNYRIDYETRENVSPKGWYICVCGTMGSIVVKHPKTMQEVDNFYLGICDKSIVE